MKNQPSIISQELKNGVLIIQLNASHYHNPFSMEMELAVIDCLYAADKNDEVKSVIITGGQERSFSVGGDFNEVSTFEGGPEVDEWIVRTVNMYVACLSLNKPTIAALDNFVIGIGFQLALCCDYRVATTETQLIMPELKNGIACVLGQYMLEKMLGRAQMLKIVLDCETIPLSECTNMGLLNAVYEQKDMMKEAIKMAQTLAHYPAVAFNVTKQKMNASFI